jgi:restriction system protein
MSRKRYRYRRTPSLSTAQILLLMLGSLGLLSLMWLNQNLSTEDIWILVSFAFALFVVAIIIAYKIGQRKRQLAKALQLSDIDTMTGVEFEQYVGRLLQSQSYSIQFTPTTGDFGVDILAKREGQQCAVQLKRYKSSVGVEAVNEAVAGRGYYKADTAMVITNSYFTNAAHKLAYSNDCELIDRDTLATWILDFQKL